MTDELRKIFLTFGIQQLGLVVDLLAFYVNCADLRHTLGVNVPLYDTYFNTIVITAAIYDFLAFHLSKAYVLKYPSVNIGRIQYLRTILPKTLLRVLLECIS